MVAAFASLID
jgi:hypothetical protein